MFDDHNALPSCHDIRGPKVRTKDVILDDEISFSSLLLEPQIQEGLAKCGYHFLSPIQKNALPLALTGKSVIVHSKSGTGKTLVFLLTSLNLFLKSKPEGLFTLILAPTREIAKQIYDVCKIISSSMKDLKIEYFIGGISLDLDVMKCRTCHIAIGAPGRIKHLITLGELKIQDVRLLVLDEVDVLINNKEFAIGEIVSNLPVSRQTIVCTATYSDEIDVRLKPFSTNLKYINMTEEGIQESASNMLIGIKQFLLPVLSDSTPMDTIRLRNTLVKLLKNFNYDQCFIFVNYISLVKSVYNFLISNDLSAMWLSSEQNQSMRMATLKKLKLNEYKILVTTDLAARGIDVHNVNLVINLGLPMPPEVYVHRMGRAGRYGSEGSVITIVPEGEESHLFVEMLCYVITEPVNLHVMSLEMNAEVSNENLEVIRCEPQPNSTIIREVIAKHSAKIENQSTSESKNKKNKKNQKKKTKRSVLQTEDASSMSEKEVPELKPELDLESLKQRFTDYISSFKSNLDGRVSPHVNLESLKSLLEPMKTSRAEITFTDYFQEPNFEEVSDIAPVNTEPVDKSLLSLAEFSRSTNAYLDSQKIPFSVSEFFSLMDQDKETILNEGNSDRMHQLKIEMWEKIRSLYSSQTSLKESTNCGRIGRTSKLQNERTTDIQESPTPSNISTSVEVDLPSTLLPSHVEKAGNLHQSSSGTADDAFQLGKQALQAPNCTMFSSDTLKAERTSSTPQSDYLIRPETNTTVQCPQCSHKFPVSLNFQNIGRKSKFSVNSNSHDIDQTSNMLALLASYVNPDVAQKIYQNQLAYIRSCVRRTD